MKDIMQKLSELEATAPKVSKKKMLKEDSATPPMNAETKPSRLKDIFETMVSGQPIPVVGKQGDTQQTGAGFLNMTDTSPAAQALGKAVGDLVGQKKLQIVVPNQPNAAKPGQPAPAGATGQQPAGQMQMKEKWDAETKVAPSEKGKYAGKDKAELTKAYNKLKASGPHKKGSPEFGKMRELAFAIRAKSGWGKVQEEQLDEKFASQQQAKLMYATAGGADTGVSKKVAKEFIKKSHGQKVGKLPKKKTDEADIAPTNGIDTQGANLGAGRSMTTLEGAKPDFLDIDKDGNKKESMKKAAADKKKQKVKESMNHRISAARLEGKSHGLRGHAHSGKRYEDLEEMKAYHEGYKEGLDECYGMGVYETAPAMPPATVGGMADQEVEEGLKDNLKKAAIGAVMAGNLATAGAMGKAAYDYHKTDPEIGMSQADLDKAMGTSPGPTLFDRGYRVNKPLGPNESEMEEGNLFTGNLAKARASGAKSFDLDGDGDMEKVKETAFAFEAWDRELQSLLNESEEVTEGLSVSVSKGNPNSPDSVNVNATDAEAEHLLTLVKNAGLGLFADEEPAQSMSVQPEHGEPHEIGTGGVDIDVVDGDDMLSLIKKMGGVEAAGANDYADEEDCGCKEETNEEICSECGGMMEAGHNCGSKEMVDEVESEDQMEFEVAEDNAPDSEEAEHTADEDAEAQEDAALAKAAQQNKTTTVNEGGDGGEASEEGPESKEGETDEEGETVSESFINLFKKLDMIAEESTAEKDDKAEKAAKKVAKDIEYDEGHKGKDDDKAEKAGEKVKKDIEYDDKKDAKEKVKESQLDEIFGFSKQEKAIKSAQSAMKELPMIARDLGAGEVSPDQQGVMQFKLDLNNGATADVYANPNKPTAHITFSRESKHKPGQSVMLDLTDPLLSRKLQAEVAAARKANYGARQAAQLDEIFGFSQKEKLIKANKQHALDFATQNGGKPAVNQDGYTIFKLPLGQAGPGQELYVQGNMYDKDGQGRPLLVLRTSQHSKYPDHNPIRFYMDDAGFPERLSAIWAKIQQADKSSQAQPQVNEWANQVGTGPGKGTDASFEQDIEFMTKVIAGGLNKPKSTGQTTIPVIAGQEDRMHDNPQDWATLAGIKK